MADLCAGTGATIGGRFESRCGVTICSGAREI
jgi:hypothetical protein